MHNIKHFLLFALLPLYYLGQSQEVKTFETEDFSIRYPSDWTVDDSKVMGTEAIIYSPMDEHDSFQENFNIITENLAGKNMDLATYSASSIASIEMMLEGYVLVSSETLSRDGITFQKTITKGIMYEIPMTFVQEYCINEDDVAYIMTFTYTDDQKYLDLASRMFNSFVIK